MGLKISYSAVSDFKACPQKYYHKKQYRTRLKASAFAFGNAIESAITTLLETKSLAQALGTYKDEWFCTPANRWQGDFEVFDSDLVFYYLSDYDKQLLTKVDWKLLGRWCEELLDDNEAEEIINEVYKDIKENKFVDAERRKFYHRAVWLCCRRRGLLMVKAFYRDILPEVKEVIACQKSVEMENEDGDKSVGYIDYILRIKGYDYKVTFDLKASGKLYSQHDLQTTDQLRSYAAAEGSSYIGYLVLLKKIKHDKSCSSCGHARENNRLKNCEKCKKGKYTSIKSKALSQVLVRKLEEEDLDGVIDDFTEITMAIKNKVVWKNPSACFNFNTKCEFYDACWNGKKLEELEHLEPTFNNRNRGKK